MGSGTRVPGGGRMVLTPDSGGSASSPSRSPSHHAGGARGTTRGTGSAGGGGGMQSLTPRFPWARRWPPTPRSRAPERPADRERLDHRGAAEDAARRALLGDQPVGSGGRLVTTTHEIRRPS